MRICFIRLHALALFHRTTATKFGGAEVRAATFARGLARRAGVEMSFLVFDATDARDDSVDGVRIRFGPRQRGRLARISELCGRRLSRRTSFPFVRVVTWHPSLLWHVPVGAAYRAAQYLKQRGRVSPCVKEVYRHLNDDVVCCFGMAKQHADAIVSAEAAGKRSVLFLANDSEVATCYYYGSRERDAKKNPGHACYVATQVADTIAVQTEWQRAKVKERFGREATLIRNPIDLRSEADPVAGIEPGYVLWVGRTDREHKRPELALEVARRSPERRFVMILNPTRPAFYEELRWAAPANVTLVPRVPFDEVEAYFAGAGALLSTSGFEGFPNTFLQAAKHRRPIVSLKVDPDGMLAEHGAGVVCGEDMDRLVQTLERLMGGADERRRLGEAGRAYVERYHELEGRVDELEALFRRVLALPAGQKL